jgi:hypothetical protein
MHNIHDTKNLRYKLTQNNICHVKSLKKDFYLSALGSFDHVFTH